MSQQIVTLFLGLVLISTQYLATVDACSCARIQPFPTTPEYCRTGFLALVKLTHSVVDSTSGVQHNYFELIQEVSDFGEVKRTSIKAFKSIDDTMYSTSCSHFLEAKGETYLIGGFAGGNGNPGLAACGGWIEKWNFTAEQSAARLAEYKAKCGPLLS